MGLFNFKQKAEIKRLEPTLIELGYIKRMNKSFGYRKQTTPNGYIEYSILPVRAAAMYVSRRTIAASLTFSHVYHR